MWGKDRQLSPRVPPSLPGRPQAGALQRKSLSFHGRVPGPQKGGNPGRKTMTFARDRPPPCDWRKWLYPRGFLGALGGWMPTLEPRLTQKPGLGLSLASLGGDPSGSICSTQQGLPASCRRRDRCCLSGTSRGSALPPSCGNALPPANNSQEIDNGGPASVSLVGAGPSPGRPALGELTESPGTTRTLRGPSTPKLCPGNFLLG